jgi:hypothetical protein
MFYRYLFIHRQIWLHWNPKKIIDLNMYLCNTIDKLGNICLNKYILLSICLIKYLIKPVSFIGLWPFVICSNLIKTLN